LHAFAEAIRTGVPAATSGADNLKSLGVVVAAMESVRRGGVPVSVAATIEG
jgi:predicted dehydrogenase